MHKRSYKDCLKSAKIRQLWYKYNQALDITEKQRQVMELYVERRKIADISEILNLSRQRIFYIRKIVEKKLYELDEKE